MCIRDSYDCNPDDDCQGTSELHGHRTLAEAEQDYEEQVAKIAAEVNPPPSPR